MANQYSADVPKGFNVPKQVRLDSITGVQNEETLKNLGVDNNLAFKYYEDLEIYCKDEKTKYIWREVIGIETGLLDSHFVYPTYDAVDGIDYSGKSFNFFLKTSSNNPLPDGSETKIEAGSNTTVTGTGTILNPYIISSTSEDSEIFLEEGDNVTITGTGTSLDPYVINADTGNVGLIKTELNEIIAPTQTLSIINSESTGKVLVTKEYVESVIPSTPDGSETKINEGDNVTITGTGTVSDPYIINSIPPITESVYIFSGDDINVTGTGTVEDPFYINATGLDLKVDKNSDIVGNTFTKITYDSKGLVLSGENATTEDIDDSLDKRYVTDSDLINLSNLSGINHGDETTFSIQSKRPIKTIEGQTLEGFGNIQLTTTDISEGSNLYYTDARFDSRFAITSAGGELSGTYPNPSIVNNAVTGKILTGLNITGSIINSTDSILSAFGKLQNQVNALIGSTIYQGVWNATTNFPFLTSGVGTKGYYYKVNVAGNTNLDGISDWNIGDWVIFNGSTWDKIDNTDLVSSVNGFTGAVNLTTSNISEGSNLYYTESKVSANIDVAANTAVRHNAVTLGTANGLSLSIQQLSLGLASASTIGALSSTDWNIFNNKQSALGYTPENVINKSDSYLSSSSTTYTSSKALFDGLSLKKSATSTAVTSTITITNNTTSITISAFTGKIVDNSTVPATITNINFAGASNVVPLYLRTIFYVDNTGTLLQYNGATSDLSPLQRVDNLFVGLVVFSGGTVQIVQTTPDIEYATDNRLALLGNYIRNINDGNNIGPNGANLQINKGAGTTWRLGSNFATSRKVPDVTTDIAATPIPGAPNLIGYRNGSGGWTYEAFTGSITPQYWDNGSGTKQTVSNNKFTNQRVYFFNGTNTYVIYLGRTEYSTITAASTDAINPPSIIDPATSVASLIGTISVAYNATALNNTAQATFTQGPRMQGGTSSGGTSGTQNLQSTYLNSLQPQITTTSTLGSVDIQNGGVSDTNNVFRTKNIAGTVKFSLAGNGDISSSGIFTSIGGINLDSGLTSSSTGAVISTSSVGGSHIFINSKNNSFGARLLTTSIASSIKDFTFPNQSGTFALTSDLSAYAPITGGTGYIQNQNASAQSANMWISGIGKFDDSIYLKNSAAIGTDLTTGDFNVFQFTTGGSFLRNVLNITNSTGVATFASTVTASNGTLIGGTGTSGYLPKWTGTGTQGNSLFYDDGTNIGLGTTSPLSGGGSAKWLTIDGTTTYGGGLISSVNGVLKSYFYTDSNFATVQGASGVGVKLSPNGADALTIPTSGNVLIGTTTDDGVNKLQVNGSGKFNGILSINTRYRLNEDTQSNQLFGDGTAFSIGGANNLGIRNDSGSIVFASGGFNVGLELKTTGILNIPNLAGTGTRMVTADASGNLSATATAASSGKWTPTTANSYVFTESYYTITNGICTVYINGNRSFSANSSATTAINLPSGVTVKNRVTGTPIGAGVLSTSTNIDPGSYKVEHDTVNTSLAISGGAITSFNYRFCMIATFEVD
jgi:hypothetical protein